MNTRPLSTFLFLLFCATAQAQQSVVQDTAALFRRIALLKPVAATLDSIYDNDQLPRLRIDSLTQRYGARSKQMDSLWKKMEKTDHADLVKVRSILTAYGWLGVDEVGEKANTALFLVIQHADTATQGTYLPVMESAVRDGKAKGEHLALLEDRVLTQRGKMQCYGSQVRQNKTGKYEFFPIADEKNVDQRRAAVGLEPLEQYARNFGIDYHLPK